MGCTREDIYIVKVYKVKQTLHGVKYNIHYTLEYDVCIFQAEWQTSDFIQLRLKTEWGFLTVGGVYFNLPVSTIRV